MPDARISELIQRTPNGQEFLEVIIPPFTAGTNRKVLLSDILEQLSPSRGDYDGAANAFPSTGGRLSTGAPMIGDEWRIITTPLTIGGADVYEVGTIIKAAQSTPGQTTGNWIKYSTQL